MLKKTCCYGICFLLFFAFGSVQGQCQEDKVVQVAIETLKTQIRLPQGTVIKFLDKKESPIPDFYSVRLVLVFPDKEVPTIVYVDKTAEKVFLGNLFIKGENVTAREAGPFRLKRVDMKLLDIEKSPFLGPRTARVTIVEFSNFQCPHCLDSWMKLKELIQKYPEGIRYVFKHFPFQRQGKAFELCEMAAAAQTVSIEAFWAVHDFLFSNDGRSLAKLDREAIQKKVEQILKDKGIDTKAFQAALETGIAKKKVEEDISVANKIRVTQTPTKVINGEIIVGSTPLDVLERYVKK